MRNWIIEKLDKNQHNRNEFTCGVDVLDEYIKTRANKEQQNYLNVTYVATNDGISNFSKPIAGFYTLSANSLKLADIPQSMKKGIPFTYDIPSVLIGRLAVDTRYQGQGVGLLLLKDAFTRIVETASYAGIKCVSVFAKDNRAAKFYEKFGFISLKDINQLILPIETLMKGFQKQK